MSAPHVHVIASAVVLAFCTFMLGMAIGRHADDGLAIAGPIIGTSFSLSMLLEAVARMRCEAKA